MIIWVTALLLILVTMKSAYLTEKLELQRWKRTQCSLWIYCRYRFVFSSLLAACGYHLVNRHLPGTDWPAGLSPPPAKTTGGVFRELAGACPLRKGDEVGTTWGRWMRAARGHHYLCKVGRSDTATSEANMSPTLVRCLKIALQRGKANGRRLRQW